MTDFVKNCEVCQKVTPPWVSCVPEMKPIPVPKRVMEQIGIDVMQLPEVQGKKYIVVAVDYFSKWAEAKALKNKTGIEVAKFIYEIICRHGCPKIQINDNGREFVNEVSKELHRLTGTKQRLTSPYHPQANGLVERQNRTIKDKLKRTLMENINNWPDVLESVLFAYRTSRHKTTGFSPFFMLYNREPVLPLDLVDEDNLTDEDEESLQVAEKTTDVQEVEEDIVEENKEMERKLQKILEVKKVIDEAALKNIRRAQIKQKKQFDERHTITKKMEIKPGSRVLVKNVTKFKNKLMFTELPWSGPFTVNKVLRNEYCILQDESGKVRKKKEHVKNLKFSTI